MFISHAENTVITKWLIWVKECSRINRPDGQQCLAKAIELKEPVQKEMARCAAACSSQTDRSQSG